MGSGASSRGRKPPGPQGPDGEQEDTDTTPKAHVDVDCSDDPPSLRRRRRVLFGEAAGKKRQQFEFVVPEEQFRAGAPEYEDPVFERLGSLEVVNIIRENAEAVQYQDNGYLRENVIQLLELGLETGTPLSRRLFEVAQVQHVPDVKMRARPKLMTCYELLALHSVLRAGQDSELLELLYCVFDADEDDRLNVADLTTAIDVFLGLQYAGDTMEDQDREDFSKCDVKARHAEARLLAEMAVERYGSRDLEPDEPPQPDERPEEQLEQPAQEPSPEEGGSEDDQQAFKTPVKPGTSKQEDSDDTGGSSEAAADSAKDADKSTQKKPPRRRGLCAGKLPAETSASEGELLLGPKDAKAKAKAKPVPKLLPKPAAKRRSRGALCGSAAKRKGQPALSYDQWRKWLAASELLPPGFAGLALQPDTEAKPGQAHADLGAGVGGVLQEPPTDSTLVTPPSAAVPVSS